MRRAEREGVTVRPAAAGDAGDWLHLRHALWPEGSESEHRAEIQQYFAGLVTEPQAVLLAEDGYGRTVGLAELSIRHCAEGCQTSRVVYLEGWYVAPEARGRGIGRALMRAAEAWGRAQGWTELASDTGKGNESSRRAHRAVGFEEVGLVRCFRKDI